MKNFLLAIIIFLLSIPVHAQNVGIGNATPRYPLSFSTALGQKLSLWDDGNIDGYNYGLGVQSGKLQLHSYSAVDNIVFGYGKSSAMTERMTIINNGDIGLDLNGRIILKNGTNPVNPAYGAGIWMYKGDNSGLLGFMGVQDNKNMGFYGGPAGGALPMMPLIVVSVLAIIIQMRRYLFHRYWARRSLCIQGQQVMWALL